MASRSLFRNATRQDLSISARCAFRASNPLKQTQRRWIGLKYLQKVKDAKQAWGEQAKKIGAGEQKKMFDILKERGLVHQVAGNETELSDMMTNKRMGFYVGIDPTASSLHVGHLLPLMCLYWLYLHGFHTVSLLGGATSKIGDPTDRLTSRTVQKSDLRVANMANIHYQLKRLWENAETNGKRFGFHWEWAWHRELVNNNAWMNKLPIMEVLQILGPGVRIGTMLGKETVRNKLEKGDGMSFSEFTYPLLQAWDWWHMYHSKKIQVQIGGADQFGNIIAGLDAVNYIRTHHPDPVLASKYGTLDEDNKPFGFTVPLLTTSSGDKFGKSAGNAIWLDKELTSVFDLYGYFLRQPDADLDRLLKLFTFLPVPEIEAIVKEHMEVPSKRLAQHKLAFEVVTLVHGRNAAVEVESQHKVLFSNLKSMGDAGKTPGQLASEKNAWVKKDLNNSIKPGIQLPMSLIQKGSIGKILHAAGLVNSNSEGHQLAAAGGAYIGGRIAVEGGVTEMGDEVRWRPIQVWKVADTQKYLIDGHTLILRKGKVTIRIIEVVSDEKWKSLGLRYPGEGGNTIEEVGPIPKTKKQIKKVMRTLNESSVSTEKDQEEIGDAVGKVKLEGKKKSEERASKPVSTPDT